MISGDHFDPLPAVNGSPQAADRLSRLQQILSCDTPQTTDELGLNDFQLSLKKRAAAGRFVGTGIAISRGSAFEHIENVDVFTLQLHAFVDNVGEEFPGPTNERFPLAIFVSARCFAEEAESRLGITDAKHCLCPGGSQFVAERAGSHFVAQQLQLFRGIFG